MVVMATRPGALEIRSFQVGFGDCFLLSFFYGTGNRRHVLIDFGSTGITERGKKAPDSLAKHMAKIAGAIKNVCGADGLAAVVATHRHADHINGFGTDSKSGKSGIVIRDLAPKVVLQPWTEDPGAAKDATTATRDSSRSLRSTASVVASLAAMNRIAEQVTKLAARPPAWMSLAVQKELMFLGMSNLANRSAIDNLIAMGRRSGSTAVWAHHGSKSGLERLLPGVTVRVLGPPNLKQTDAIRKMRSRDPDEFWQLLAGTAAARDGRGVADLSAARGGGPPVPAGARWFRDRLDRLTGEQLLEIVRTLDQQMNNTSVILLFEVFGRKLLFPGDAQIENWSYALEDAPDAAATRKLLADVDVYKVGHHGSLNATPRKALWEKFSRRKNAELHTMLSTMPGKHGHATSNTEVPRRTLLTALAAESRLQNTMDLGFGAKGKLCNVLRLVPGQSPKAWAEPE